jgi:DNA-binding NarL/FixJ family response regulator
MKQIKVLIVDDHPVVRDGLKGMLANHPDFNVVADAGNGQEAVRLAQQHAPDVILMDLRMPVMDGVAAINEIKQEKIKSNVLVLTTYDSDEDIVRAIEAGATGYLLKDTPRHKIYQAIRSCAQGESVLDTAVATRLLNYMRTPPKITLSPREVEVLGLVAQGASNQKISQQLYISVPTVKTHLIHIFGKLGVDNRTAAVTAALEQNLISLEDGRSR